MSYVTTSPTKFRMASGGRRRDRRGSIPRLITVIGGGGAAFVIAAAVVVSLGNWRNVTERTEEFTRSTSFFLAEHAARMFDGATLSIQKVDALGKDMTVEQMAASATISRSIRDATVIAPYIRSLLVYDTDGRIVSSSLGPQVARFYSGDRDVFATDARSLRISRPLVGRLTGQLVIPTSMAITRPDGSVKGYGVATLSPVDLYSFWARMTFPTGAKVTLFRKGDQAVLATYPEGRKDDAEPAREFSASLGSLLEAQPTQGSYVIESDVGQDLLDGSYARIGNQDAYIRVSVPRSTLVDEWLSESIPYLSFAGLALLSLTGLALFARHQAAEGDEARNQLHLEVERQTRTLLDRTGSLETMVEASRRFSGTFDLEDIVQTMVDAGRSMLGAGFGAFFHARDVGGSSTYAPFAVSGMDREALARLPMPGKTQIFESAFEGTGTTLSDDITQDPRYGLSGSFRGMPPGHPPVRSYLSLPVVSPNGTVHGAFLFGDPRPSMFQDEHVKVLEGLAAQAAIAMDNAKFFAAAQTEIERRRANEAMHKAMNREMHHRVKNNLAVVSGLVGMTARHSSSVDEMKTSLIDRLVALGRTHTLLTDTEKQSLTVRDLLAQELAPYLDANRSVTIDGEAIHLVADQVMPVGMALHELATNAVKYGALSVPEGRLEVSWHVVADDEAGRRLHIVWRERGGPSVTPPRRKGFGSTLIEKVVGQQLSAKIDMSYETEGLVCVIEFGI